jgi:hypothetical protein
MRSCAGADRAGRAVSAAPARSRSHELRCFVLFQSLSLFFHQATAVTESDAAPVALAVRESDRVNIQAAIARGAPPGAIAHARSLAIATLDLKVLKPPAALPRPGTPPFIAGNRVALLVQSAPNPEICGVANDYIRFMSDEEQVKAFTVIGVNCATTDRTFTHELGHTMGGRHSWIEDPSGVALNWQLFRHGYGFANQPGVFRTIMNNEALAATSDVCDTTGDGCARINRWSSGRFSGNQQVWINGAWRDLGNRGILDDGLHNDDRPSDMVFTLNEVTPTVAQYRNPSGSAPSGPPYIVASPFCNGVNLVEWGAVAGAGWYELNDIWGGLYYRGGAQSLAITVYGNTPLTVRACNVVGCSTATGGATATTNCP